MKAEMVIANLAVLVGFALVVSAVWWIYAPAGLVVCGVGMIAGGVAWILGIDEAEAEKEES